MNFHPLANIFPMMNEIDFEHLKKDIQENGFDSLRPIILYEESILDGRNRFKACEDLNISPAFKKYDGSNPLYYVISNNLNRRHLNESQRALVATRLANFSWGGDRSKSSKDDLITREKAAEIMNVSTALIDRVKEIEEKLPEEIRRIEIGETTIGNVYGELKRKEAETPEWLRFLDVWTFKENNGEGISNLPPEIIKNLLYYYTKEGDLVCDFFAGSGQTYNICKEMNRECICSDISPKEDFIIEWDVDMGLKRFPEDIKKTQLIFLDPPYWDMVDYGIGWNNYPLNEFLSKFDRFLSEFDSILSKDGKIALIIMPLRKGKDYVDLGFLCYELLKKRFKEVQRICVPLIRNWALDHRLKECKEKNEILTGSLRDLIIFERRDIK